MNNYFNYQIPEFNENYGSDWIPFREIINENTDYLFKRIYKLYGLDDIDRMPLQAVRVLLDLLKIDYENLPTNLLKVKLRIFPTVYAKKGTIEMYREIIESVTGIEPEVSNAYLVHGWRWGTARMNNIRISEDGILFQILIKTFTAEPAIINDLKQLLRDKSTLPAFYTIYLIDSNGHTQRV